MRKRPDRCEPVRSRPCSRLPWGPRATRHRLYFYASRLLNQAWTALRTCSLTGTPSLSHTCCSPRRSSSSIRKVNVRRRALILCVSHRNTLSYIFPHAPVLENASGSRPNDGGRNSICVSSNKSFTEQTLRVEAENLLRRADFCMQKGRSLPISRQNVVSPSVDLLACARNLRSITPSTQTRGPPEKGSVQFLPRTPTDLMLGPQPRIGLRRLLAARNRRHRIHRYPHGASCEIRRLVSGCPLLLTVAAAITRSPLLGVAAASIGLTFCYASILFRNTTARAGQIQGQISSRL